MANGSSATAATSPARDPATDENSEYKRDKFWEFGSILIGALIGAFHAFSANEGDANTWHAGAQIVTEILIFGGLGYLVRQADFLRIKFTKFQGENKAFQEENKVFHAENKLFHAKNKLFQEENERDRIRIIETEIDTKKELHKLCIRAEKSMEIKEGIYGTIGQAFAHQNAMVRRFLMGSIGESLRPLEIGTDKLVASSDLFTRSLYGNFWDELLEEQERRGSDRPLEVYLSHASSISVFEDEGAQDDLLVRQEKFSDAGGKIRRVLIRNPDLESKERYEAVMARMKDINTEVKLLDLGNNKALRNELVKDFLLVKIDGQPYVLEWLWLKGGSRHEVGQVHGTHIHLTPQGCREFYDDWSLILRRLKAKSPQEDLSGWNL